MTYYVECTGLLLILYSGFVLMGCYSKLRNNFITSRMIALFYNPFRCTFRLDATFCFIYDLSCESKSSSLKRFAICAQMKEN